MSFTITEHPDKIANKLANKGLDKVFNRIDQVLLELKELVGLNAISNNRVIHGDFTKTIPQTLAKQGFSREDVSRCLN